MLSAQEWWSIIEAYGVHIWPAQLVAWAVATVLVSFLLIKPGKLSTLLIKLYLVLSFAWIGIGFFITLGKGLAGNYFFGALFTIVAILFAVDLYRQTMQFGLPEKRWQRYLTIALMLVVLGYPLFGMVFKHYYPRLIVLGTFPCPTTALALLLLTTSLPKVDKIIYSILLFWAVPIPPLVQIPKYGVYEDGIMLIIGIYSLIMLAANWKKLGRSKSGIPAKA